ncbi:MAG: acyl-CoA dehydrogenase family protein [Pseudomonadota bacterium]|jgi:acyl-CoA dehydrogenase|uniref:acyl-CoA dehydrogenase family protein n=1 Tax=Sphingobium yanoikuyae TaxID=13690 RepID=UPI0013764F07|nr:acyl-CoA dehydrogenase family protein [Sphingobium yanoikuyae]NBB38466.1 acyl-CoA dehydrogenase [Sphingobium yanoikuyae]
MTGLDHRFDQDESKVLFRQSVRRFLAAEAEPHLDRWEAQGNVDRAFWQKAGAAGLLCPTVPEIYGGPGLDFSYNAIVTEEHGYARVPSGITLQSDVLADYLLAYGSEAQKQRWLPAMVSGAAVAAIAMTEPGAGSDLQAIRTSARRDGDDYQISGTKTYISNGQSADLVIVVARTSEQGSKGLSLFLVEADRPGFQRGCNLDKIGLHGADTSELFFDDVRVPAANLLGQEGSGFAYLMRNLPQERLTIAIAAQAAAQRAFDEALAFVRERKAFGQRILDFQNSRFTLAGMATQLQVGWSHIDWALARHLQAELTPQEAAAAKLWHSDMQGRVTDIALQLHGGAGYMNEYPIARMWRDARVTRIFGGTNEIMKEVIGRAL